MAEATSLGKLPSEARLQRNNYLTNDSGKLKQRVAGKQGPADIPPPVSTDGGSPTSILPRQEGCPTPSIPGRPRGT